MRTVVFQSHHADPPPWITACLTSVKGWAADRGYDYRFFGDEIFSLLPDWYRSRTASRPMVATDLGRLLLAQDLLREGWGRVVWMDADMLVFRPDALDLDVVEAEYAFGREVWVQREDNGRLSAHKKVHNAICVFLAGNPILDFYAHACERLVARYQDVPPPHLVGPKFLRVLHNLLELPVVPRVTTYSPLILEDILAGGGPALTLHDARHGDEIAAANLCASLVGQMHDDVLLDSERMLAVVGRLTAR